MINMTMDHEADKAILIVSGLIMILGAASNALSFYYFWQVKPNPRRRRNSSTSTRHLFRILNCFDLLICAASLLLFITMLSSSGYKEDTFQHVLRHFFRSTFLLSVGFTYFVTCLLAVRRAINLTWPIYMVKRKSLDRAIVIFICVMVTLEVIYLANHFQETIEQEQVSYVHPSQIIQGAVLSSLFIIIISASIYTYVTLRKSYTQDHHKITRYATVTVGILSVIFCACNIGPLFVLATLKFVDYQDGIKNFCQHVLVPLNSALNPIVYFTRRAEMRSFLIDKWERICKTGSQDEEEDGDDDDDLESRRFSLQEMGRRGTKITIIGRSRTMSEVDRGRLARLQIPE